MPPLIAAPDKFRGTATAQEVAAAVASAAARVGVAAVCCPMSDGGEGFVDVVGTDVRAAVVAGPLGGHVTARWSLRDDGTAIVESAQAAGRALLANPAGDDPLAASTYGVGELIAAACSAGAARVVVGCGGTATTDGGLGCVRALDDLGVRVAVPLVAACDVTIGFLDAAAKFGPQKGASPDQVRRLAERLAALAEDYRARFGVDVPSVAGSGAGGGLAGGLVALGASVVSGAAFAASTTGLSDLLAGADLVVTGEGSLDEGTLEGKVVDVVLSTRPDLRALVVAGRIDEAVVAALRARRAGPVHAVALSDGAQRRVGTTAAIAEVVATYLASGG